MGAALSFQFVAFNTTRHIESLNVSVALAKPSQGTIFQEVELPILKRSGASIKYFVTPEPVAVDSLTEAVWKIRWWGLVANLPVYQTVDVGRVSSILCLFGLFSLLMPVAAAAACVPQ